MWLLLTALQPHYKECGLAEPYKQKAYPKKTDASSAKKSKTKHDSKYASMTLKNLQTEIANRQLPKGSNKEVLIAKLEHDDENRAKDKMVPKDGVESKSPEQSRPAADSAVKAPAANGTASGNYIASEDFPNDPALFDDFPLNADGIVVHKDGSSVSEATFAAAAQEEEASQVSNDVFKAVTQHQEVSPASDATVTAVAQSEQDAQVSETACADDQFDKDGFQ